MKPTLPFALIGFALAGCSLVQSEEGSAALSPDDDSPPIEGNCEVETNVIGVYQTRGDHSAGNHPTGEGRVSIQRPGRHRLVLSSYEPTSWTVEAGPDVVIESVHLVGYHTQTVNEIEGATVTINTIEQGEYAVACGYYFPSDTGGCDTPGLLAFAEQITENPVSTFHGCYDASEWILGADGSVQSDCDTQRGYEVTQHLGECLGGDAEDPDARWQPQDFRPVGVASCFGPSYVKFDARYELWIGAIECVDGYRLYGAADREGTYYELTDTAGHGQDHCELVNPDFTIPNEDDITSGGCSECSIGDLLDPSGLPVYSRANFGEPFQLVTASFWGELNATYLNCGVRIP